MQKFIWLNSGLPHLDRPISNTKHAIFSGTMTHSVTKSWLYSIDILLKRISQFSWCHNGLYSVFLISMCFIYISNDHHYITVRSHESKGGIALVVKNLDSRDRQPGFEFQLCTLLLYDLCLNFSICKLGIIIVLTPHMVAGRIK